MINTLVELISTLFCTTDVSAVLATYEESPTGFHLSRVLITCCLLDTILGVEDNVCKCQAPFPLGLQASANGPVGQADSGYTDRETVTAPQWGTGPAWGQGRVPSPLITELRFWF